VRQIENKEKKNQKQGGGGKIEGRKGVREGRNGAATHERNDSIFQKAGVVTGRKSLKKRRISTKKRQELRG